MANDCVLYNPLAGNGRGAEESRRLDTVWPEKKLDYVDLTTIEDVRAYLDALPADVSVILAGGDGTINRFINALGGRDPGRDVYYFATGSGNDFLHDLLDSDKEGKFSADKPLLLNPYMKDLPVVQVNGMTRYFINGIGYGIDGYCCEVGDKIRATSDKPVNYTAIAIKGLLFGYHRTTAEVTVDGKTESYKHVWLVPTMNGRFYGGGMMCAPGQDRLNPDRHVTVMVMRGLSKLKTLMVFPSIFKGEHIKHTEMVTIRTGHRVTVKFDRPTALQIDGETVLGVTEYAVETAAVRKEQPEKQEAEAVS